MVIGREFEIVPVLPFAVATTLPSIVSVSPVDVRVHDDEVPGAVAE